MGNPERCKQRMSSDTMSEEAIAQYRRLSYRLKKAKRRMQFHRLQTALVQVDVVYLEHLLWKKRRELFLGKK